MSWTRGEYMADVGGHLWTDDRGPGSVCERCRLPYPEWSGDPCPAEPESFDFRSIRLRPEPGSLVLYAECLHPTCGWVMGFTTYRMDVIIETCRDHACRRQCACVGAGR